jgi:hypothetical protein
MDETQPVDGLVHELEGRRKRDRTRTYLTALLGLWLLTFAALVVVAWNAYFKEKDKALTLAQQIIIACEEGNLQPDSIPDPTRGLSAEERKVLCSNAKKVVEQNDPELQDDEIQEPEIQDPEFQDPEFQNPEKQNKEIQDPEIQDPEVQDPEEQDPEIQDQEIQDPEIDDPDPNDPPKGGSCTFDGRGTFTFTWETENGQQTVTCTGTDPGPQAP